MHQAILNQVSDEDLKQAYQSRFRVEVGDMLKNSWAVAGHLSTHFSGRSIIHSRNEHNL